MRIQPWVGCLVLLGFCACAAYTPEEPVEQQVPNPPGPLLIGCNFCSVFGASFFASPLAWCMCVCAWCVCVCACVACFRVLSSRWEIPPAFHRRHVTFHEITNTMAGRPRKGVPRRTHACM